MVGLIGQHTAFGSYTQNIYILIVKRRYSGLTRKKFETQIGDESEAEYLYYSKTSALKVVKHVSEKSQSSWFVQFVAMLIAHYSHSLSAL